MAYLLILSPTVQILTYVLCRRYPLLLKWIILPIFLILNLILADLLWAGNIEAQERICGTGRSILKVLAFGITTATHLTYLIIRKSFF